MIKRPKRKVQEEVKQSKTTITRKKINITHSDVKNKNKLDRPKLNPKTHLINGGKKNVNDDHKSNQNLNEKNYFHEQVNIKQSQYKRKNSTHANCNNNKNQDNNINKSNNNKKNINQKNSIIKPSNQLNIKKDEKINEILNPEKEEIFSFSKIKNSILIPIKNVGNISYITMPLQCFANFKNITRGYINFPDKKKLSQNKISLSFIEVLKNLYQFQVPKAQFYDLKNFHQIIIKNNVYFKVNSTKNIFDFLTFFLDSLHMEQVQILGKENAIPTEEEKTNIEKYLYFMKNNMNTIIVDNLVLIEKNSIKCNLCKNVTTYFDNHFVYDLDISNSINRAIFNDKNDLSIFDCLKFSMLPTKKYNIYCKNCANKCNFEEKKSIISSQSILTLTLNGIETKEILNKMKNYSIKIRINEKLDISELIDKEEKFETFTKYVLHSIIYYNINTKQYISYITHTIDAKWYKYEGEKITPANDFINKIIDNIDNKIFIPVILFYRHEK